MNDKAINLHVGSLDDMGARFAAAWRVAERGGKPARDQLSEINDGRDDESEK